MSFCRPRWRAGKPRRRRQARSGADPGAALSLRKRFGARNAGSGSPRFSALADTGLCTLSPEPAAFTARPRVHRLARPRVRRGSRLMLGTRSFATMSADRAAPSGGAGRGVVGEERPHLTRSATPRFPSAETREGQGGGGESEPRPCPEG
jgi:hypothetical protein